MSTCMALGQLHPGTDSSKTAPQKLLLAASSVAQTGSAATTGAILSSTSHVKCDVVRVFVGVVPFWFPNGVTSKKHERTFCCLDTGHIPSGPTTVEVVTRGLLQVTVRIMCNE